MKRYFLLSICILLLLSLPLKASPAEANGYGGRIFDIEIDKQQGMASITTDNLTVTIESHGNVPKFSFYANDENTTRFHVHFIKIMEFTDTNGDGKYNESEHVSGSPALGLSSVSWNLTDFINESGLISFNFTSDAISQGQGPGPGPNDYENFMITLAVHFETANGSAFKFDILMANWPFADPDNMLALRWDLTWDAEENNSISVDPREDGAYLVRDDEDIAYFVYEDSAQVDSADVDVDISYDNKMEDSAFDHGIKVFLSYPNFNGSELFHDPTLGILTTDSTSGTTSEEPGDTSSETAGISGGDTEDGTSTIVPFPAIPKAGFLAITVVSTAILAAIFLTRRKKA